MNIIGLSAFYHESACCLLQDGHLRAAVAEERLSRVKHDPRLPVRAFRYCLQAGGLTLSDVDCLAYYESPHKKLDRQLRCGVPAQGKEDSWRDPKRPHRAIRERLGYQGPIQTFEHHQSHAASAFFFSSFKQAALFTVDGVGEWATTSYGRAQGVELDIFEEVAFPHSLGLLYGAITAYLGFAVNRGEYKVMGLAALGRDRFAAEMRRLVHNRRGGGFELDMSFFDFVSGRRMYSERLIDLFGRGARRADQEITAFHQDVARSLQSVLEEILLQKVDYLERRTAERDLCLSGGVALNSVAVGRIEREGPFRRVFVQPAAGDSGACLGAAALAHVALEGKRPGKPMRDVFLGPRPSPREVCGLLRASGLPALDFRGRERELLQAVVDRLERGKVVGWLCGPMEFGPRALGARSILADPRVEGMKDRLNAKIKKREPFRPFAPAVLEEHASEHFDLGGPSPFMSKTCRVTSNLELPAITHVDKSARPQTVDRKSHPRFAALIELFYRRTGCPVLLNTSLNVRGEPIASSAADALACMAKSGLDALVLEDFLVDREMVPENWQELLSQSPTALLRAFSSERKGLEDSLYTLV